MFARKKQPKELMRAQINTLIGKDTTVVGVIKFKGGLHVIGTIKGGAESEDENSLLIINEGALVTGDIYVNHLIVNGTVEGNVYVKGKVELFDKAHIEGDVHYGLIELPVGAQLNGKLIRYDEETA